MKQHTYILDITCPLCGVTQHRDSSAPFIYLDTDGIQAHSSHTPGCTAEFGDVSAAYVVTRRPNTIRQLVGDPMPDGTVVPPPPGEEA